MRVSVAGSVLGLRLSRPLPYCEGDLHIHSLPYFLWHFIVIV